MQDHESRELKTLASSDEVQTYVFQIEYPIGTIFCIPASSAFDAAGRLALNGIEPFMIRRAGVLVEMEGN